MKAAVAGLTLLGAAVLAWGQGPPASGKLSPGLQAALARSGAEARHIAWVFFADKGRDPVARVATVAGTLSGRAAARRARRGTVTAATFDDMPLASAYVDAVTTRVDRVRQQSRWFNAVSVEATPAQLDALGGLPFVRRLELVRRYRGGREAPAMPLANTTSTPARSTGHALDYGFGLAQVEQIAVPAVHDLNLSGEGVMVAVFDTGFNNLAHEVFSSARIQATRDFVNGDADVADASDMGEGSHGTATLSVLGGFKPGQLIGPAYNASFILAKTENTASETPIEEDNWAAAAEWVESLGADVISSSLGYLDYDAPFPDLTHADMNGETAVSTRAADLAADRGVVVVNSAGNSGFHPEHNTLGAPADGRLVLAIGAVDFNGGRVGFSSVGPTADGRFKPDLAARGSAVRAASPFFPSSYVSVSGTSFSCPLTAGVVALVLQAHPDYTLGQVHAVLRSTASQASRPDNLLGWGIVNALAAVQADAPGPGRD